MKLYEMKSMLLTLEQARNSLFIAIENLKIEIEKYEQATRRNEG